MDKKMENFVLDLMKNHNHMSLATLREDGYPQANTVTYANDGLTIYFATGQDRQKVKNIRYSNKVSLTIDKDYKDWNKIKGLSLAATAGLYLRNNSTVIKPKTNPKIMNSLKTL